MAIGLFSLGLAFGAAAQEGSLDTRSNGKPQEAQIDEQAAAELERAQQLFVQEGKEKEALELARTLIPKFEKAKDFDRLVDCYFLLGDGYYWLGDYTQAVQYMSKAWELGNKYFSDRMSSYPLKVIGESEFQLNQHDKSLKTFEERVSWLRKKDDTEELAGALFDVAGLLINIGRENDALQRLQEAEQANNRRAGELNAAGSEATPEELDANAVDHAEIVYHMAIANFKMEKYVDARRQLEQAEAFFTSIQQQGRFDVSDRLYSVLDDLVEVCEQLDDKIRAEAYRLERDRLNQ